MPPLQKALRAIKPEHKIGFAVLGLVVMAVARFDLLKQAEISSWAEISGWVLLVIGFAFAGQLDRRFELLITRLHRRGIIGFRAGELESFRAEWRRRASEGELAGAIIFPILMAGGYWLGYEELSPQVDELKNAAGAEELEKIGEYFGLKLALEFVAAIFLGGFGGRMLVYGRLGRRLRRDDVEIRVIAGHSDEAGGLRLVGDFYLLQAFLIFLPATFFAFWFVMAPIWESLPLGSGLQKISKLFLRWQWIFGWSFLGLMAAEVAAFFVPVLNFHRIMTRQADRDQAEIDGLWGEVTSLKSSLGSEPDPEAQESIRAKITVSETKVGAREVGPRWPFNAGIRKRLAWGNVLLFLFPLVANQEAVRNGIKGTLAQFFGLSVG